jgi:hypothetical protein
LAENIKVPSSKPGIKIYPTNPSKFVNFSQKNVVFKKMLGSGYNVEIIENTDSFELIAINVENKNETATRKLPKRYPTDFDQMV